MMDMIPIKEWAAQEGCPIQTAQRMAREMRFPYVRKIGGQWFVPKDAPNPSLGVGRPSMETFYIRTFCGSKWRQIECMGWKDATDKYNRAVSAMLEGENIKMVEMAGPDGIVLQRGRK